MVRIHFFKPIIPINLFLSFPKLISLFQSSSLRLLQFFSLLSATKEKFKTSISPPLILTSLTATAYATTSTPSLRLSDFSFSPSATEEKAVEASPQIKFLPKIYTRVQEHGEETILPLSCALKKMLVDMSENKTANTVRRTIYKGVVLISLCCYMILP